MKKPEKYPPFAGVPTPLCLDGNKVADPLFLPDDVEDPLFAGTREPLCLDGNDVADPMFPESQPDPLCIDADELARHLSGFRILPKKKK